MAGDGAKSDGMGNVIGGNASGGGVSDLRPHVPYTDLR